MVDGLGLVFEQQGNTGAAAYDQPSMRIGQNPLDRIAADIGDQVKIEQQNQLVQQKQNEKLNQQALEVGGTGWEVDNDRQLGQYLNAMKNEFVNLQREGVKPTDYNNPKSRRYWELKQGWENLKSSSLGQKEQFNKAYQAVIGDMNSPNPQFDHEQTFAKMKQWQELPIEERLKTPIDQMLVKKELPFDMYSPIKDVKLSEGFIGETDYENPEYASSKTKLNEENLYQSIKKIAENPVNDAHFETGKKKGLWDTRDEYAQVQFDKKKLEYTEKSSYKKKEPPGGYTLEYINGGNANDLMTKIGYGKQTVNVTTGDGTSTPVDYKYTTQLGDINAVVGAESLIDASTGKPIGGTGTRPLKSGAIVLAPVYKGTNTPYPLTAKMNEKELLKNGTIEFKPMVMGKATEGIGTTAEEVDVWVPASAVLKTTGENKTLTRGQVAYEVYQKKANDLNKPAATKTAEPPKVKKEIKAADIPAKARAAGYSEAEYRKLLQKNGVKII